MRASTTPSMRVRTRSIGERQRFFTGDALTAIAETTITNFDAYEKSVRPPHEVIAEPEQPLLQASRVRRSRSAETVDHV